MAFSDLTQALTMFQDGVKDLAINHGIANATAQVQDINSSVLDENQKRQAKLQLANGLQGSLAGLGASGTQIQAAVGSIAPPAIKDANDAYSQAVQTGDPTMMKMAKDMQGFETKPKTDAMASEQKFTGSENQKNRDLQREIAGMKQGRQLAEHEFKAVEKTNTAFEQANKDNFAAYAKANTAIKMLDSDNPVADKAVLNLLVKTTGDTGAITDSDRAAFAGSPQLWAVMKRNLSQKIESGQLDDASKKQLKGLAQLMAKRTQTTVEENADRMTKTLSKRLGVPPEDLRDKVFPGWEEKAPQAQVGAPARTPITIRQNGKLVQAFKDAQGKVWLTPN